MDARKKNVLLAVVEAYIQTGEPVGSKMISQLPQIHVSAATVRKMEVELTSVRRAFSWSSGIERAPQLHIVDLTL